MSGMTEARTKSNLAFEKLLDWLDVDRERAWEKYGILRRKLVVYFQHHEKQIAPEEFADKVFDRLERKLEKGDSIRNDNPPAFCYRVARFLLLEYYRSAENRQQDWESASALLTTNTQDWEDEWAREKCQRKCLSELKPADRRLLLLYYGGDDAQHAAARKQLATELALSPKTLRKRASRLRQTMRSCFARCMGYDQT
jgi:DNA-directed RNA polymerase specialized sigma24 family protein